MQLAESVVLCDQFLVYLVVYEVLLEEVDVFEGEVDAAEVVDFDEVEDGLVEAYLWIPTLMKSYLIIHLFLLIKSPHQIIRQPQTQSRINSGEFFRYTFIFMLTAELYRKK